MLRKRKNTGYPNWLRESYSYTSVCDDVNGFDIGGIRIGNLTLEGNRTYPAHFHEASEIYIILAGTADWYIDDEMYQVKAGDILYHPSGCSHGWTNTQDGELKTIWLWWDESLTSEQLNGIATLTNKISSENPSSAVPHDIAFKAFRRK